MESESKEGSFSTGAAAVQSIEGRWNTGQTKLPSMVQYIAIAYTF